MNRAISLPLWLLILLVLAVFVLALVLWSVKRRKTPRLTDPPKGLDSPMQTIAGLVHSTAVTGNSIRLVQNGAFFDELFADLAAATASIHIEAYLTTHGSVTKQLTDLLVRRQSEGVQVRVLLDGNGGRKFGRDDIVRMHRAGCAVHRFHPLVPSNLGRFNQRTHRKMVIIDGRIGYIGGHCFVDHWLGDAEDRKHFRDVSARCEGPVVAQLQSAFSENWVEETGEVFSGESYFPPLERQGDTTAHVAFISPVGSPSAMKLLHYSAIREAKSSITIQNPYFLPDPQARDALIEAAARGVRVRIMIPSTDATDAKLVSHASHHHYGSLLNGGIQILEYERTLLHQKVFVIDESWCSIGSANFDDRSFEINDEVTLVIWDSRLAQELETIFERDAVHATRCRYDTWSNRTLLHKFKDGAAYLLNEQL